MIRIDEHSPEVWRVELDSPADRNALGAAMRAAIMDALDKAHQSGVKVVIVGGDSQAFSSGYKLDPGVMRPKTLVDDRNRLVQVTEFMRAYRSHPVVTIAEVRGYCLAGGTDLMLCSDIAMAASNAQIGVPNVRGIGITFMLAGWAWLVGPQRAKLLALSGDFMSGDEAAQYGLVAAALPEDQLQERALRIAERIARMPRELLEVTKMAVNSAWDSNGLDTAIVRSAELDALSHGTEPVIGFWDTTERDGIRAALRERDEPFEGPRVLDLLAGD